MISATFTLEDHPNSGQSLTVKMDQVTRFIERFAIERGVDGEADGGIVLSLAEAEFVAMVLAKCGVEPRSI